MEKSIDKAALVFLHPIPDTQSPIPDTRHPSPNQLPLPHHLQKIRMHPRVVRQLRMEGRPQKIPLPYRHRLSFEVGQYLNSRTGARDVRRPDKYPTHRLFADRRRRNVRLEAVDLPAKRIAGHGDIQYPEPGLVASL